jgi:hypothetical protein
MTEAEARRWPELMAILEAKVKPARQTVTQRDRREIWWLHATRSPVFKSFLMSHRRCIAVAGISRTLAFTFVGNGAVINHKVVAFALDQDAALAVLQSRAHETWARFFGSTFKDDLTYTPTDCFETFPFPPDWQTNPALGGWCFSMASFCLDAAPVPQRVSSDLNASRGRLFKPGGVVVTKPRRKWSFDTSHLEAAGKTYYDFRASLMADDPVRASLMNGLPPEGLTATYNRFHDPDETLPGILRLRELHAAMDRAVLDAYGWTDLVPTCAFLLDYEEENDQDDPSRARQKKKPWRYRWPDEVRDEVLARLLALNAERAAAERRLGIEAGLEAPAGSVAPRAAAGPKRGGRKKGGGGQGALFE